MDIARQLEHEREVRRVEQELAERLRQFDVVTRVRILSGLMIAVEAMPATPAAPGIRPASPALSDAHVSTAAPEQGGTALLPAPQHRTAEPSDQNIKLAHSERERERARALARERELEIERARELAMRERERELERARQRFERELLLEREKVRAAAPEAGPTGRIYRVLREATAEGLTAHKIISELERLYPNVKHDYVQQVLSRSAKRGGPFARARKDPGTGMWLYFLRENPPAGVNPSEVDAASNQEDDV
ncbi:hypothetical protein [Sorangium sp. So ce176]|uniref:hypothetical protein n=1 Tax=Sorangium sp. So ce176 TaxID=3133286 RepID=UPI003F60477B